jgi:hypothetical protein
MKSDKLKKLLKKIKKLKKLRKSNKVKKTKSQNLYLSADIETLKNKVKQQDILLSQMRFPQQTPVSTVSYERMGIGQQNALNQANLEAIQKNIETKNESDLKAIKQTINDENQVKLSELEEALKYVKQKEFRQQRVGETDKAYEKYKKDAINSKNKYALKKLRKSMNDTSKETTGVKNLVNAQGTLKEPIYSDTDNQGEFPVSNFNSSINTPNSNETFDNDVEQINNDIKADMNQLDNKSNFVDTTTDQSIQIKEEKIQTPKKKFVIKTDKPLSKAELRKLKKEEIAKQQTNTEKVNIQQVEPNIDSQPQVESSRLNFKGMNISLGKNEAKLNKMTEQMNQDTQQLKTGSLNLFTDS